ncbi:MAG: MBOAT family protein [Clostridia bacterium]|nr:MBOAT family protein [Clostridia bacterium]
MVFSHLLFIYIFLPLLLAVYFIIKNDLYRRIVLVVFSLVFYAWGEPIYVFLMIGLVLLDYLFGRLVAKDGRAKKLWLVLAIIANLSALFVFKYLGFFIGIINDVFKAGIVFSPLTMPIGISFFTFQAMSYVIDVYRKDSQCQRNPLNLLLYVSFFPQLIAGPIVRYKDIEAQLQSRSVQLADFNEGFYRFSIGLAKKVLIADSCAVAVNAFYGLTSVTVASRWLGAVFFTLQIYFDFSGYSDMAIGLGRMFGFSFNENFNYPLTSSSATEFWRRWHISLGTFFRDYVYIPLGGNRKYQYRNILIVWFLTGFWHGASWNFIIWGMYYAVFLVIEKTFLLKLLKKIPKIPSAIIGHTYTVLITVFGFAIFYFEKDTFRNLGYLFGAGTSGFTDLFTNSILSSNLFVLIAGVLFSIPVLKKLSSLVQKNGKLPYAVYRIAKTCIVIALFALCTIRLVGNTYSPFLYFRF